MKDTHNFQMKIWDIKNNQYCNDESIYRAKDQLITLLVSKQANEAPENLLYDSEYEDSTLGHQKTVQSRAEVYLFELRDSFHTQVKKVVKGLQILSGQLRFFNQVRRNSKHKFMLQMSHQICKQIVSLLQVRLSSAPQFKLLFLVLTLIIDAIFQSICPLTNNVIPQPVCLPARQLVNISLSLKL